MAVVPFVDFLTFETSCFGQEASDRIQQYLLSIQKVLPSRQSDFVDYLQKRRLKRVVRRRKCPGKIVLEVQSLQIPSSHCVSEGITKALLLEGLEMFIGLVNIMVSNS